MAKKSVILLYYITNIRLYISYVISKTGMDTNMCGNITNPCGTLYHASDQL